MPRLLLLLVFCAPFYAAALQNSAAAPAAAKPTEHILGTITAIDGSAHSVTVKDDKTGASTVVSLAETKTLLKVAPGAKDLKGASRITADDLAEGDRVDVRGSKSETTPGISARSVVLMSARDLARKQELEQQEWSHSTVGTVQSVDAGAHTLVITSRSADGPKQLTVQAGNAALSRYSADHPSAPVSSDFTEIQSGDQVHIIGDLTADGSGMAARRIYSAPARTVALSIISLAPDGQQLTGKALTGQSPPTTIVIQPATAIRKLPPEMAAMLARRFNAGSAANGGPAGTGPAGTGPARTGPAANGAGSSPGPANRQAGDGNNPERAAAPDGQAPARPRGGDLSRMLERVPTIPASDLKPGDAVVVWGMAGREPGFLVANIILAGVEPVLQSAPASRRTQTLNSDWGLDTSVPAQAQ